MMAGWLPAETGPCRSAKAKGEYMNNLNSILIEGNLVRDPQLRTTPKGTSVCNMIMASSRFYREESGIEKEVSFFDIEAWGKLAEACYEIGKKGRGVRVVGRLRQDRWTGADGKNHARIVIVAEHVEFRPEFEKQQEGIPAMDFETEVPPTEEGIKEPVEVVEQP